MDTDVIVVGAGLSGLVAAHEIYSAGYTVMLLDQENAANLGGQAYWSFGGLFLVDSPMQRRLGVKDSAELAWQDWQGSAGWDRLGNSVPRADNAGRTHRSDHWAVQWAREYVEFAAGEQLSWLRSHGIRFTPMVGWAERGDGTAGGHGNSVPRFHIAWGTGTGISEPFADHARTAADTGRLVFAHRHRVEELITDDGAITGVRGTVLAGDDSARGVASSREPVSDFEFRAQAVVIASGGIGGNHEMVRSWWPERLGPPPSTMLTGVPAYVDGSMLDVAETAGARLVNRDRMWHYTEGVANWDPAWPGHGIRILPGPSSMWFDALGRQLPVPGLPGYDTRGTLQLLRTDPDITGYDHSWFVLTQKMIEKEFALSGSEQNPDITDRDYRLLAATRLGKGAPGPVEAFKQHGEDFVVADSVADLVAGMNRVDGRQLLNAAHLEQQIRARDAQLANPFSKDTQIQGIHNARRYRGDRLMRVAAPHRMLDPAAGPLIAVRLRVLTRKSLGGIQTDLSAQALDDDGAPVPGLYAVGEAAGFGGGGMHGYNALEGTFLGGCLFSGRTAGRAVADQLG